MHRMLKNRWTFILALCVCAACGMFRVATAAVAGDPSRDGTSLPDPSWSGDPDVPGGSGFEAGNKGTLPQKRMTIEGRVVGDDQVSRGDRMWRLIVILKGLKGYWFRF